MLEVEALKPVKDAFRVRFPRTANLVKSLLQALRNRTQMRRTFTHIYETNAWGGESSFSGQGSSLEQTVVLRNILPSLLGSLKINSMLDAPCGDHFWMKNVSLDIDYIGVDIVPEMVAQNRRKYGSPRKKFLLRDITKGRLPRADCILCRDCLDHLSFADAFRALRNFKRSGARYLLVTTYTDRSRNDDIVSGEWRPTNFLLAPFSFPTPIQSMNEQCTEEGGKWADKSLALWRIDDLNVNQVSEKSYEVS